MENFVMKRFCPTALSGWDSDRCSKELPLHTRHQLNWVTAVRDRRHKSFLPDLDNGSHRFQVLGKRSGKKMFHSEAVQHEDHEGTQQLFESKVLGPWGAVVNGNVQAVAPRCIKASLAGKSHPKKPLRRTDTDGKGQWDEHQECIRSRSSRAAGAQRRSRTQTCVLYCLDYLWYTVELVSSLHTLSYFGSGIAEHFSPIFFISIRPTSFEPSTPWGVHSKLDSRPNSASQQGQHLIFDYVNSWPA